jgi:hypothetical protein
MPFRRMIRIVLLMGLAFTMACGGGSSSGGPLTPARNLAGTWKTSIPVRVTFQTDFCNFGTLEDVLWQTWAVTFVVTPGVGDNEVLVDMSFQAGPFTPIAHSCPTAGAFAEPSPISLRGTISSTNLVLRQGATQVANFNFTTSILTGTFDYTYQGVYDQREYTAPNTLILLKQ